MSPHFVLLDFVTNDIVKSHLSVDLCTGYLTKQTGYLISAVPEWEYYQ